MTHFCTPEDSGCSLRVRTIINTVLGDFDETKYGHLQVIIHDPHLRHVLVDVTKPSMSPTAHAQAQAAARTVFGCAGTSSLLTAVKKIPGHMRLTMVPPLKRIAQVQEAVQAGTLEAEAAPEDIVWCRYCEHLVQHILGLVTEFSRRSLRDGSTTDQAHTSLSELHDIVRKISLEKPPRCFTVEGAINCMRLIVPEDWSKADILRGCLRHVQTGTLPNDGASDYPRTTRGTL